MASTRQRVHHALQRIVIITKTWLTYHLKSQTGTIKKFIESRDTWPATFKAPRRWVFSNLNQGQTLDQGTKNGKKINKNPINAAKLQNR